MIQSRSLTFVGSCRPTGRLRTHRAPDFMISESLSPVESQPVRDSGVNVRYNDYLSAIKILLEL